MKRTSWKRDLNFLSSGKMTKLALGKYSIQRYYQMLWKKLLYSSYREVVFSQNFPTSGYYPQKAG